MGQKYVVDGTDNTIAADSIIHTERGAGARHSCFYLTTGSAATPADQTCNWELNRVTGGCPAGAAVTPEPFNTTDAGSITTAFQTLTTEPTKAETLLKWSHNLRANFQWYANPGAEFIAPDTAGNGFVIECIIATADQVYEATLHFDE